MTPLFRGAKNTTLHELQTGDRSGATDRRSPLTCLVPVRGIINCGMDPTSFRMRHLLGIVAAAIVLAAVLRHVFHVHLGLSREEIRVESLTAVAAIIGVLILARYLGRRWRKPK